MSGTIREGTVSKGGQNEPPTSPRPGPPSGQAPARCRKWVSEHGAGGLLDEYPCELDAGHAGACGFVPSLALRRVTLPRRSVSDLEMSLEAMTLAVRRAVELLEMDIDGSSTPVDALLILRAARDAEILAAETMRGAIE